MSMKNRLKILLLALLFPAALHAADGAEPSSRADFTDALLKGFQSPPPDARPEVFWDWMHDMVSKEGITHDLEAMKRAGFSGAVIMLVGHADSQFNPKHNMPKPVKCLSPEFFEHWKFAAEEANRLGLTLISQCGPGWTHSGGPWIKPEHAVQLLAFSDVTVSGPLAQKKFVLEPAQGEGQALAKPGGETFTRDIAVIAMRGGVERLQKSDVIELTHRVRNGALIWDVPEGSWIVRRYGIRNSGGRNRTAPLGGSGLECDKLSREANQAMFEGMVGRFVSDSPQLAGKSIIGMEADSWEVVWPEWTADFRAEFQKRRGYDPLPWVSGWKKGGPIYLDAGLQSRFKQDWALTSQDLFADNFFSYLTELCAKHGLMFMTEPYYGPFDPIRCGGRTVRPMGEFWSNGDEMRTIRWAASSAHTYGRKMAGAESFTARWNGGVWAIDPYALKRIGDLAFCNGLNKMTLHGMAHQPWGNKVKPGMSLGWWGTMFVPGQTWWEPGRAWVEYVARCQFMLQQGQRTADILCLSPKLNWKGAPEGLHQLYDYDLCSEETLLEARYQDGRFILPHSDAGYRVLLLPSMGPGADVEVLRKVVSLVKAGGTVLCVDRPKGARGLSGYPGCDQEVQQLASELWGASDGKTVIENRCGQGRLVWLGKGHGFKPDQEARWCVSTPSAPKFYHGEVGTQYWPQPLCDTLRQLNVPPDVEVRSAGGKAQLWGGLDNTDCGERKDNDAVAWIHRRDGDRDIYFVASQVADPITAEVTFRVTGKVPEFWNPETGQVTPATTWRVENGRTVLPISFTPFGSLFVVFRPGQSDAIASVSCDGKLYPVNSTWRQNGTFGVLADRPGVYEARLASGRAARAEVREHPSAIALTGPWRVTFPSGWGAPSEASMDVGSWSENKDPGIRYFSGTATYARDFEIPKNRIGPELEHYLDLGKVKNLAEVFVNGQSAGILWKPPFRVNVTRLLEAGKNRVEIKVTNLWVNRMVGDEQHPDDCQWKQVLGQDKLPAGSVITSIPDWVWTGGARPEKERHTFAIWKFYDRDTPLLESGLMGPVQLDTVRRVELGFRAN